MKSISVGQNAVLHLFKLFLPYDNSSNITSSELIVELHAVSVLFPLGLTSLSQKAII
jgi:hypothetical protein